MYRTKDGGTQRRFKIGTCGKLSLADATREAKRILSEVEQGKDPAAERHASRSADTIAGLVDLYIEKHAKKHKKSWRDDERMLKLDVVPAWGPRKAKSIRRRDVIDLLEKIVERGAPISANRTFEVIRRMFGFAIEEEIIDAHPCVRVKPPGVEKERDRVLTEDEIRRVWAAFEKEGVQDAAILKLRLLTLQRGIEVRSMRWADIDPAIEDGAAAAWWTVPADTAKNGLAHRVPVTAEALALLRAIRRSHSDKTWVFPGKQHKRTGSKIWGPGARVRTASGVDFVPHDLRRTGASFMASMGISRATISKVLNHVETGVTKVYDRYSYDSEKRRALEAWAARLDAILSNHCAAPNVLEIRRA